MDIVENRSGSLTDALNKIRIADDKITELKTELSKWQIDADVDVFFSEKMIVRVRIYKENGDGFSFDLDGAVAAQYADDPDTLIQAVSEKIYDILYKNQIKDTISAKLNLALRNAKLRQNGTQL